MRGKHLGAAALAAAALGVLTPTAFGATIIVDDYPIQCKGAAYSDIQAAVDAASAEDTIKVCAGTYSAVDVDKKLVFKGALAGKDARTGRTDASKESVVSAPGKSVFHLTAGASGTTIDGFTIRDGGGPDPAAGTGGTAGWQANGRGIFDEGAVMTVLNNVITNNSAGVYFRTDAPTTTTTFRLNRFVDNTTDDDGHSGIFSFGPTSKVLVESNLFSGHVGDQGAAINTGAVGSTGWTIRSNRSRDDATFLVLAGTSSVSVTDNRIYKTAAHAADLGSGIYFGGNTDRVTVAHNTISRGGSNGISVRKDFGGVNTNLAIDHNTIVHRRVGIFLLGQAAGKITNNRIFDSANEGILADADSAGNVLSGNIALGNGTDYADQSSGSKTAGTANTWSNNVGESSSPDGLGDL